MKPALDQVLFRSTRTTLPLWPVRCKNSYSLQRGMKFIGLHPHQNQNETGFTPFTQGLGAVGRPSHRRGAFIQSEDLEGGAVWPRNVWQKCCLWPDIFLPVGILVMQVFCSTGQKAGYSIKNSSLSPFLNFFSFKVRQQPCSASWIFLFHCWHLCSCLPQALFINLKLY